MGALGPAMIFISLLVLGGLVGVVVLTFAARCFGVIVEQTAAGSDEVAWPDEPMVDWLGRALHLLWLVAFWLVPVALLLRLLRHLAPNGSPALFFLPPVVLFWVLFPVSLLSSYSAVSRWVVFRPAVLAGLFRVFPATATFYLLTAVLISGLGGLSYVTYARNWALLIPVVAAAAATGLFVYARLLGRLGGQLRELEPSEPAEPPPSTERPPPPRKKRRPVRGVKSVDPWAVPKEEEPPEAPNLKEEGYGLASTDAPSPAPEPEAKRKKPPRPRPYGVSPEEPPRPPAETPLDGYLPVGQEPEPVRGGEKRNTAQSAAAGRRRALPPRAEPPRPPAHPFTEGIYTFPWYPTSVKAWLAVTAGLLAMGGILQALISVGSGLV
jgi:hypothetical protein